MTLQHHEFELRLRDAERLRLYVQSGMAKQETQSALLKKAEFTCRRLELEAKESAERAARAEPERDVVRHEAAMAKLKIEGAVNTRAHVDSELTRVQCALVVAENAHLKLVMELGTIKDDFAAFREKVVGNRETMEAEFDSSGDALFNYCYGCCIFTHNICGSKPQIPDGMREPLVPLTPEFFANPRCPHKHCVSRSNPGSNCS